MARSAPSIVDKALGRALSAIRLAKTEAGREWYRKGFAELSKAKAHDLNGVLRLVDADLHRQQLNRHLHDAADCFRFGRPFENSARRSA